MIIAILDACVLYPPSVRDLLMRLAASGLYSPRWTEVIESEWVRNVLKDNTSISRSQLECTCRLMEQVDPKSLIFGNEVYIPILKLPDVDDRHVLAAAIHASASHIVTYNTSDFPQSVLAYHDVEATHPDIFLSALFDEKTENFLDAVQRHRAALRNPPKSAMNYVATLRANALNRLAERMEAHSDDF